MNINYLVDTDWIIDHLRGDRATTEKLNECQPAGIGVSIISVGELYEGVYHSRDPESSVLVLKEFLGELSVIPVDEDVCKEFGKQRSRLRERGELIGDFDLLIGATCLRWGLILLTNNHEHFGRIDGLDAISIKEDTL